MLQQNQYYSSDSLARNINYDIYYENTLLKKKNVSRKNMVIKAKFITVMMIVFLLSMNTLYRYAVITDLNYRIHDNQREYERLADQNKRLKIELINKVNLTKVRQVAEQELRMHRPYKNQIVFVDVPKIEISSDHEVEISEKKVSYFKMLTDGLKLSINN